MAAKDMAAATKNVLKDAGNLFSDTAHEAVSAAVDTAHIALHSMKAKKDEFFEEEDTKKADMEPEDEFLDDDYVDDDDQMCIRDSNNRYDLFCNSVEFFNHCSNCYLRAVTKTNFCS